MVIILVCHCFYYFSLTCKLYSEANMLLCKFSMCPVNVKYALFRASCTQRPIVAYNDTMKVLLQVPRWHSPSQLLVFSGIHTYEALQRRLMYTFMCRLDESENCMDSQLLLALIKAQKVSGRLLTDEFLNRMLCCGILHHFRFLL